MNGKQAIEILIKLDTCFDMNFENDEKKYQMWVTKLTEKGDYEKRCVRQNATLKKIVLNQLSLTYLLKTHYIDQQDDYDDKTKGIWNV